MKRSRVTRDIPLFVSVVLVVVVSFQAHGASDSKPILEEVIVTAQKRAESIQDVPASVSALTAAQLERMSAVRLEDYATQVPSLTVISERTGAAQVVLRGVTSGGNQPYATVGTYVDETPFGSSTIYGGGSTMTPDLDTADIARIEILRGPQGTLYGANALGGLIKFVTVDPDPTKVSGRAQLDGSSIHEGGIGYGVRGLVNLPLSESSAVRISGYKRRDAGFLDDSSLGEKDVNFADVRGGRLGFLWSPDEAVRIRFSSLLQDTEAHGSDKVEIDSSTFAPVLGALEQRRFVDEVSKANFRIYNLTMNFDLGWADLMSATSHADSQTVALSDLTTYQHDFLPPGFGAINPSNIDQHKTSQEIRLSSKEGRTLEWIVGGFYTQEESAYLSDLLLLEFASGMKQPGGGALLRAKFAEYALFGDLTYHITRRFDVTFGGRYSKNKQTFAQTSDFGDDYQRSDDNSFTYLITPRWRLSDTVLLYARAAQGYRPGGPNIVSPVNPVPPSFGPTRLVNYELGAKGTWLDGKLQLDAAAFQINWHDVQIAVADAASFFFANAGRAETKGFEVSGAFAATRNLKFSGYVSRIDAAVTGTTPGTQFNRGDRLAYVPRWSGSLNADYDFSLGGDSSGFVGASFRYIDKRSADFVFGAQRLTVPSYELFDLRAGVAHGDWTLSTYLKNVLDKRGINRLDPVTPDPASRRYDAALIQPRTAGVSLAYQF